MTGLATGVSGADAAVGGATGTVATVAEGLAAVVVRRASRDGLGFSGAAFVSGLTVAAVVVSVDVSSLFRDSRATGRDRSSVETSVESIAEEEVAGAAESATDDRADGSCVSARAVTMATAMTAAATIFKAF